MSHDLKNLLGVVTGRLELVGGELESEHIEVARRTANRMAAMVESFTELAEKGQIPSSTEPVEIASIAEESWKRLGTEQADLQIEDDLIVIGDPEQLQSLFENLFQNALEHGGPDVTVWISSLPDREGFSVEDDGPGIASTNEARVFEVGQTTAEEDQGKGFGLAFVKHIADAHGWGIDLVNNEKNSARFEFTGIEVKGS
jgi:signal transduction histidine kinase